MPDNKNEQGNEQNEQKMERKKRLAPYGASVEEALNLVEGIRDKILKDNRIGTEDESTMYVRSAVNDLAGARSNLLAASGGSGAYIGLAKFLISRFMLPTIDEALNALQKKLDSATAE